MRASAPHLAELAPTLRLGLRLPATMCREEQLLLLRGLGYAEKEALPALTLGCGAEAGPEAEAVAVAGAVAEAEAAAEAEAEAGVEAEVEAEAGAGAGTEAEFEIEVEAAAWGPEAEAVAWGPAALADALTRLAREARHRSADGLSRTPSHRLAPPLW